MKSFASISYLTIGLLFIAVLPHFAHSQSQSSFVEYQKSFARVSKAFYNKEDTLKKQFAAKKLTWPLKQMYIRSFKYNSDLQVWVKNNDADTFSFSNPTASVHWPAPWVPNAWKAIIRYRKDSITSMNSTRTASIICRSDSTTPIPLINCWQIP